MLLYFCFIFPWYDVVPTNPTSREPRRVHCRPCVKQKHALRLTAANLLNWREFVVQRHFDNLRNRALEYTSTYSVPKHKNKNKTNAAIGLVDLAPPLVVQSSVVESPVWLPHHRTVEVLTPTSRPPWITWWHALAWSGCPLPCSVHTIVLSGWSSPPQRRSPVPVSCSQVRLCFPGSLYSMTRLCFIWP